MGKKSGSKVKKGQTSKKNKPEPTVASSFVQRNRQHEKTILIGTIESTGRGEIAEVGSIFYGKNTADRTSDFPDPAKSIGDGERNIFVLGKWLKIITTQSLNLIFAIIFAIIIILIFLHRNDPDTLLLLLDHVIFRTIILLVLPGFLFCHLVLHLIKTKIH